MFAVSPIVGEPKAVFCDVAVTRCGLPPVAMDFVAVSDPHGFVYAGGSCDSDDGAVPLNIEGVALGRALLGGLRVSPSWP